MVRYPQFSSILGLKIKYHSLAFRMLSLFEFMSSSSITLMSLIENYWPFLSSRHENGRLESLVFVAAVVLFVSFLLCRPLRYLQFYSTSEPAQLRGCS